MAANWSYLSIDMLEVIVEKMDSFTNYQRFRAVCSGWRSLLPTKPKRLKQPLLPYLMFLSKEICSKECPSFWSLLEPLTGIVVDHLELPNELPRGRGNFKLRGSSKGWLVATEKEGPSIYLINTSPTDEVQLRQLPPINTFPEILEYRPEKAGAEFVVETPWNTFSYKHLFHRYVEKVVLSSSPTMENFIAMAVYGDRSRLAYCNYGDEKWTDVLVGMIGCFDDIIFYGEKCYAVNYQGDVLVLTFHLDSSPTKQLIAAPPKFFREGLYLNLYLVMVEYSTGNHLLMVGRNLDWPSTDFDVYETVNFNVYNLNLDWNNSKQDKWSGGKVENLDNHILFLGCNESLSFSSHILPGRKGDFIYYTDDYQEGYVEEVETRASDLGVFNFEDNSFYRYDFPSQIFWPAPIWVMHQNTLWISTL